MASQLRWVPAGDGFELVVPNMPFRATFSKSAGVTEMVGGEVTKIARPIGLVAAILRARLIHPQKLSGAEMRFIRKTLGMRANVVARLFQLTPQYWSRCETDAKQLSNHSEKLFRLMAFILTFAEKPARLIASCRARDEIIPEEFMRDRDNASRMLGEIVQTFFSIDIVKSEHRGQVLHLKFTGDDTPGSRLERAEGQSHLPKWNAQIHLGVDAFVRPHELQVQSDW